MDEALLPGETIPRADAADDDLATGRLVGADLIDRERDTRFRSRVKIRNRDSRGKPLRRPRVSLCPRSNVVPRPDRGG